MPNKFNDEILREEFDIATTKALSNGKNWRAKEITDWWLKKLADREKEIIDWCKKRCDDNIKVLGTDKWNGDMEALIEKLK